MAGFEKETIINFNEEGKYAEIYTASARVANHLKRAGLTPTKIETMKGKPCGWFFKVDKSSVIIKPKNRSYRIGGMLHAKKSKATKKKP